jgi:hypothetical protein
VPVGVEGIDKRLHCDKRLEVRVHRVFDVNGIGNGVTNGGMVRKQFVVR